MKANKKKAKSAPWLPEKQNLFKILPPPALQPGESPLLRFEPVFSDDEIARIRAHVDNEAQPAGAGVSAQQLARVRRSRVNWLEYDEHAWVYERVWALALKANLKYRFRIDSIADRIQVAIYDEEEQGFYRWHSDNNPHLRIRKISLSIPLNSPDEYEGGNLEFNLSGDIEIARQDKGVPIAFPSYVLHRVTPVTRGRRYSMVAWIYGPQFA